MSQKRGLTQKTELWVENIGGIESSSISFGPGVTILSGRNATNRTSLLQALMAALGSNQVSIKGDAEEAHVELKMDDGTHTRRLRRENGRVRTEGNPYLDEHSLADLFAFLLGTNEVRQAIVNKQNLRDLLMRPVNTDEIEAEINRLTAERDDLEEELSEIDSLKKRLPDLEAERTDLRSEIESKKEALEDLEAKVSAADADLNEKQENEAELERKLDELREKRSSLDQIRFDIETEKESLEALRKEKKELDLEKEELPDTPGGDITQLEDQIKRLRDQKQSLESQLDELQSVVQFNEQMLDDRDSTIRTALSDGQGKNDPNSVTDQLVEGDNITCWTCGGKITRDRIEATVDHLRNRRQDILNELNEIREELSELKKERKGLQENQRKRERIENRLADIEDEVEETKKVIEELQGDQDKLTAKIESIEEEVEELESESYSELLDLHKEANQVEYELGRLETDLESVNQEIENVESRIEDRERIEEQKEQLQADIGDLRTRIERIEQQAIEEFNEHMENILHILEYENIERIWLERREKEVREGRQKVEKSVFELHVIRSTESGTAYEDTIDHLSESEREVTGLVFALAGYLAHEVYDHVPFMLLDSVEAVDSERLARLIEYFNEYCQYLIVALLPEDAAALDDEYQRITNI